MPAGDPAARFRPDGWGAAIRYPLSEVRAQQRAHRDCPRRSQSAHCGGECLNPDTVGLREVVKKMDENYKILIDLIYFKQYTQQEAADEIGIPVGTVKTRMRYAILELKKAFGI